MDEHEHSRARMRYSKFVHYVQNYRHRTDVVGCRLPKFHGFNLAPLCSIRSRVEVNFIDVCVRFVCGFDARSRNCSRFDCRYGFHEDVLDSVYVPILLYYCTRTQYVALAIVLSDSGERMHRDEIPPQRMHAACRIVTRGSCCTKRFAEFNGNCES